MSTLTTASSNSSQIGGLVGIFPTISGISFAYVVLESEKPTIVAHAHYVCEGELAIRQMVSKFVNDFNLKGVNANYILPQSTYEMLLYEAPNVAGQSLSKAMRWLIRDAIDFPIEEAMVDAFLLPYPRQNDNAKVAYVIAAKKEAVLHAKMVLKSSQLRLMSVDIPEMAIRNIVRFHPANATGSGFLWLDRQGGILTVIQNGIIEIVKKIEVDLSEFLITPVGSEDALENLARELQMAIESAVSTFSQVALSHFVLLPSELKLLTLQPFLESKLEKTVALLELTELFQFSKAIATQEEAAILFAVGAALRVKAGH